MISNLNGSGSVRVHRKKAVFTGSRFRLGFGSTLWLAVCSVLAVASLEMVTPGAELYGVTRQQQAINYSAFKGWKV